MHVSSVPYLILHLRFAFSHPIFVQNQSLIPYLFQSRIDISEFTDINFIKGVAECTLI